MSGRPRTSIGTYGTVRVWRSGRGYTAETRYRDVDGRLGKVRASHSSRNGVSAQLKERLKTRPRYCSGGLLTASSPFADLVALWLADLERRDIPEGTKQNYRDDLRLHVGPFFEHYTEQPFLEICWGVLSFLLLGDRPAHLRSRAGSLRKGAAGQGSRRTCWQPNRSALPMSPARPKTAAAELGDRRLSIVDYGLLIAGVAALIVVVIAAL